MHVRQRPVNAGRRQRQGNRVLAILARQPDRHTSPRVLPRDSPTPAVLASLRSSERGAPSRVTRGWTLEDSIALAPEAVVRA